MFESKYSKLLTIILVVVILAILGLLAFLGFDMYQKYFLESDALAFVENYTNDSTDVNDNKDNTDTNTSTDNTTTTNPLDSIERSNTISGSSGTEVPTFKGYNVMGTIEIPAINLEYPVLEKMTRSSLETSVTFLYGSGINQPGNTVIAGHNYRNGLFFSNNKRLNIGDKIYLTDNSKNRLTYTIYDKFDASPEDATFYSRDTGGVPEVTLTTCSDDSSTRLILLARAD